MKVCEAGSREAGRDDDEADGGWSNMSNIIRNPHETRKRGNQKPLPQRRNRLPNCAVFVGKMKQSSSVGTHYKGVSLSAGSFIWMVLDPLARAQWAGSGRGLQRVRAGKPLQRDGSITDQSSERCRGRNRAKSEKSVDGVVEYE